MPPPASCAPCHCCPLTRESCCLSAEQVAITMTLPPPCSASAPKVLSWVEQILHWPFTLCSLWLLEERIGVCRFWCRGQCWLSAGQEHAQEQLWKPGLSSNIKLVVHIFFRLCANYMKSNSSMLMSAGSFGGKVDHSMWSGMCWDICLAIHCNQTHCSSPTLSPLSFLASVCG